VVPHPLQIFGKFDRFCRRIVRLMDLFSTVHQFAVLADSKMDGMGALIADFNAVLKGFRSKNRDPLNMTDRQFDTDYVELNQGVSDVETRLQNHINRSFEEMTSIEESLKLLKRYQGVLLVRVDWFLHLVYFVYSACSPRRDKH
jgi:dynein heavy chain, axonemal